MEYSVLWTIQMGLSFLNNCFGDVKGLLMTAPADYADGAIWDVVVKINTGIQGIGYGLLVLFFLMTFFKTTSNFKDLSIQQVIGWIARFLIVKFVIDYGIQVLNFSINVSMGINDTIFQNATDFEFARISPEVIEAAQQMINASWWERLGAIFQSIPMGLLAVVGNVIMWAAGICLVVCTYLRFFRLFIYSCLAPVPLSTLGSPETSQTGKHFLKAYAACCLEICVIALAIVIFTAMASNSAFIFPSWEAGNVNPNFTYWNTLINYLFQIMLQSVMLVVVVMSANRFIREMLGV